MNTFLFNRLRSRWLRLGAILLIGSAAGLGPASSAAAASIAVNTTDDEINRDGDCSLREAVQAANADRAVDSCVAGNGADTITVPAGSYTGPVNIASSLTIRGAGIGATIIDGRGQGRVFAVIDGAVIIVGLTIQNGASQDHGSGISNAGTLTLNSVSMHHNYAITFFEPNGGAIFNSGTLTISHSLIHENAAIDGGAIYNTGTLTVTDTTFDTNSASRGPGTFGSGGAIFNRGTASIQRSLLRTNEAMAGGGAIVNSGTLAIQDSSLTANEALVNGGGIANDGTLTLINSTLSGNIARFGSYYDPFPEAFGGAIVNGGRLIIQNSTLSSNAAKSGGGAIYGSATVENTIIAANTTLEGQPSDCLGRLTSQGYNLLQTTTGCTIQGDTTGNRYGVDPQLSPLQDNGGPTPTHALLPGSPAIDAGNPSPPRSDDAACVSTDQRGLSRPQDGDGDGLARCDMGAYEVQGPAMPGKVTGGGTLASRSGKVTFGFVVQRKIINGSISGSLEYQDQRAGIKLHDPQFQQLTIADGIATFSGTATVNRQAGTPFTVTVRDTGEGRASSDTFSIRLATGYTNQGQLTGGNIQIHRR